MKALTTMEFAWRMVLVAMFLGAALHVGCIAPEPVIGYDGPITGTNNVTPINPPSFTNEVVHDDI